MASWVAELFPPKFKVSDYLHDDERREIGARSNEDVQKIYEEVFEQMSLTGKDKKASEQHQVDEGDLTTLVRVKPIVLSDQRLMENQKLPCKKMRSEETVAETACLWSAQELKVLRNSVKCSKLNNIRLRVLTQALQKDCEHVRNMCREQANEILTLNKKYSEIRKKNKTMKITCKAFKEDAKTLQGHLEECRGRLVDANRDKQLAELELVKIKHQLEVVQKQNKMLELELEKQTQLQEKLLDNQNVSLRLLYEKEMAGLLERLKETEVYLKQEENEHIITKKALVHLRLHFISEDQQYKCAV